jgi:hypothetical protein
MRPDIGRFAARVTSREMPAPCIFSFATGRWAGGLRPYGDGLPHACGPHWLGWPTHM